MNCKPGDLAVIVRSTGHGFARKVADACIGHYVVVEYLRPPAGDGKCFGLVWKIAKPFAVFVDGNSFEIIGVEDECLRPIRDPGDDAQDETLSWLPVPIRDEVAA